MGYIYESPHTCYHSCNENNDIQELICKVDQMDRLRYQVCNLTQRLEALENRKFPEKKKRVVILTDSYGNSPSPSTSFSAQLKKVLEENNIDCYTIVQNGAGMVGATEGLTFLQALNNNYRSIPNLCTITDLYVIGGANDYNASISDIIAAGRTFVQIAKTMFPSAMIHIACLGNGTEAQLRANIQLTVSLAYRNITIYENVTYVRQSEYVLKNNNLISSDGVHPNQEGADACARFFTHLIITGEMEEEWERGALHYSYIGGAEFDYVFFVKGNHATFDFIAQANIPSNTNITADFYQIGTVSGYSFIYYANVPAVAFPTTMSVQEGQKPIEVGIADGKIFVRSLGEPITVSGYLGIGYQVVNTFTPFI